MKVIQHALMLSLCLFAASANATLISAGTYTFNLDFTSSLPYTAAREDFTIAGLLAGQNFTVSLCTDTNGGGVCGSLDYVGPTGAVSDGQSLSAFNDPGFVDGIFSVRVALTTGTVDVTALTASVRNAAGATIASQTLIPSAIPEPATLALIGLGLSGLALTRRRKSH